MLRRESLSFIGIISCFLVIACGDDATTARCTLDSECPTGRSCFEGFCIDVPPSDAGTDSATIDSSIGDSGSDAGSPDAGPDSSVAMDAGPVPMRSLDDYPGCERDADCPIGLGRCLTELTFNLPDADGLTSVSVQSLDASLTTAGICTLPCTEDANACSSLQLRMGDTPVEYACQVMVAGASPYEVAAGFPFAVDAAAAEAGQAFAAICRPPLGLSEEHDASLCEPCTADDMCGTEGLCWDGVNGARGTEAAPGECIETPHETAACAFGFEAAELVESDGTTAIGEFCVPLMGSCGACQDGDGDERGIGLCAGGVSPSPIDCDDMDADAYYDPADMSHAFPTFCGAFDKNCNGESDDAEQFVSADHCGGCGVVCSGAAGMGDALAARECQPDGSCGIACDNPAAQADCDGDLDNGCETAVTDPSRLVYYDGDMDGDGTPNMLASPQSPLFTCTPGVVPAGYAATNTDCDDGNSIISGAFGVDNSCNNVDENCSGARDEGYASVSCSTGMPGVCSAGSTSCGAGGSVLCNRNTAPASEMCDNVGADNDCDGATSDIAGPTGADVTLGAACVDATQVGSCRNGTYACLSSGATRAVCVSNGPSSGDSIGDGIDSNCDGVDGNANDAVYVSTTGNDSSGDGSPARPYRTIQHGLNRARPLGRPLVRVASGRYVQTTPLILRGNVLLIGRFNPNGWTNDGGATTVVVSYNNSSGYNGVPGYPGSLGLTCEQRTSEYGGTNWVDYEVNRFSSTANAESVVGGWFENCDWLSLRNGNLRVADAAGVGGAATGGTGAAGITGAAGGGAHLYQSRGASGGFGGASSCSASGGRGGDGGDAGYGGPDHNGGNGGGGAGPAGSGGSGGQHATTTTGAGGSGGIGAAGGHSTTAGSAGAGAGNSLSSLMNLLNNTSRRGSTGGSGTAGGGGGGGGGGGAGLLTVFDHEVTGTSGGGGGSGGCGGRGGSGGFGGGSSIGIVVEDQDIWFENFHVFPGDGGTGGTGGVGGVGGVGGTGGAGGHVNRTGAGAGAAGGNGGSGSGGGGGGGGAGGSSIAVAALPGTTTSFYFGNPELLLYRGTAGGGGPGGTGGAAGSGGTTSGQTGTSGSAGSNDLVIGTSL